VEHVSVTLNGGGAGILIAKSPQQISPPSWDRNYGQVDNRNKARVAITIGIGTKAIKVIGNPVRNVWGIKIATE